VRESERRRLYLEARRAFAEVRSAWAKGPQPGSPQWAEFMARWDEVIAANDAYIRFIEDDAIYRGNIPP
jgi:hypothetical protein